MAEEIFFYILIRSWHSFGNFDLCINSVFSQTYKKFQILFVDDASPLSQKQKNYIKSRLKGHIAVFNKNRLYSLRNAYNMIRKYGVKQNAVVLNLDGDDRLLNSDCLSVLTKVYRRNPNCLLTWGECLLEKGAIQSRKASRFILPNTNKAYPRKVVKENSYRTKPFLPLHPRTWRVWLFNKIKKEEFLRPDGRWLRFAEDQAIFFPMLEMAGGRFYTLTKPIYVHNFGHRYSDSKANLLDLVKDELTIRKKPKYERLS